LRQKLLRFKNLNFASNVKACSLHSHPLRVVIKDCKYLLELDKDDFKHIWKEANHYADVDFLANENI